MKINLTELLAGYEPAGYIRFDRDREISWKHDCGGELYDFLRQIQPATLSGNRFEAQPKDRNARDLAPVEVSKFKPISKTQALGLQ